jgi:Sperm-tail PG-rich repeat
MIRQHLSQNKDINPPSFSTIGKDSVQWSFAKARRFKNKTMIECPGLLDLPSTLEKRAAGFGYGKRWQLENSKGKDAPSPDKYNIPSCFDLEKRGPTLQGSERDYPMHQRSSTPGPGTYSIGSTICKDGPKFSFRPRMPTKIRQGSPPPGTYDPKYNLLEKSNYSEISFGNGPKAREDKPRPNTPGPGTYEVPSSFTRASITGTRFYNSSKSKYHNKPI